MKTNGILRTTTILLIASLFLVGGIGIVMSVSAEGTDTGEAIHPDFPEFRVTEENITTMLGGGHFIGLHNGDNDAMIGLLYGTRDHPNNVYIVSLYTRYLGTADVFDENGNTITRDKPIAVRTLYAQKFDRIYEFNDVNDDGIWDSRPVSIDPNIRDDDNTTYEVNLAEPVYKKVNLRTAWERSGVSTMDHGNGTLEWAVTLTAKNLNYRGPLLGLKVDRMNKLEKVALTFHLTATHRDVTKNDIPVYRVSVSGNDESNYRVKRSSFLENRSYSGSSVDARVKYDHLIEGWDFNTRNTNPALLMSTEVLFANGVSPRTAEWIRTQFTNRLDNNGSVEYETPNGTERVRGDDAVKDNDSNDDEVLANDNVRPRLIRKNRLHFNDNWQNVGWLRWVSNVTVDGKEDTMYFQVYRARRFAGTGANGGAYAGFALLGGFAYPGGSKIVHDPTYSSEAFSIVPPDQNTRKLLVFPGIALIGGVVAAVLVIAGVGYATRQPIRKRLVGVDEHSREACPIADRDRW